jgi:hypothetical protein
VLTATGEWRLHSLLLASRSEFFYRALAGQFAESKSKCIELHLEKAPGEEVRQALLLFYYAAVHLTSLVHTRHQARGLGKQCGVAHVHWLYMLTRGSIGCTCLQGAQLAVHVYKGLDWLYMFSRGSIGCTCLQGAQLAVHVYKGLNWLYMFTRGSIGCTCLQGAQLAVHAVVLGKALGQVRRVLLCCSRAVAVHWPCIGRALAVCSVPIACHAFQKMTPCVHCSGPLLLAAAAAVTAVTATAALVLL